MAQEQENETLTMDEWETRGELLFREYKATQKVAANEIPELIKKGMAINIDRQARTDWLKQHGFDVTRENMFRLDLVHDNKDR